MVHLYPSMLNKMFVSLINFHVHFAEYNKFSVSFQLMKYSYSMTDERQAVKTFVRWEIKNRAFTINVSLKMDAGSSSCCSMFIHEIFGRKKGSNARIKQKRNQQTIKVCAVCMQYCILCIKPHTYQRRRIMWSALLSIEAWKKWSERENKYQSNRNIHNNNNINKRLGGTISDAQKNWKRKRRIHKNNKNKYSNAAPVSA